MMFVVFVLLDWFSSAPPSYSRNLFDDVLISRISFFWRSEIKRTTIHHDDKNLCIVSGLRFENMQVCDGIARYRPIAYDNGKSVWV